MLYFEGAKTLKPTCLGQVVKGQDGAIRDGLLYRFTAKGRCFVYDLPGLELLGEFTLDKADLLCPHSNAVFFWENGVLYTNIYNNYAKEADRLEGVCCAYRITRDADGFRSQLLQVIRVNFVHTPLWQSDNGQDVRPYGNFVADGESLYAFVMRDETHTTRFFRFPLPPITAGETDATWGVPVVRLKAEDIRQQFDRDYVNFMQGAICHKGLLYSVEGFTYPNERDARPVLRVFDLQKEKQVFCQDLTELGLSNEPELVDVVGDVLYYVNHDGQVYRLDFAAEG